MSIKAPDILNKAAQHMMNRAVEYDSPRGERSMEKTVQVFNTITRHSIKESDGWLFMQILKDVRQWSNEKYHEDSGEDSIAYSALKCEALVKEDTPDYSRKPKPKRRVTGITISDLVDDSVDLDIEDNFHE